MQSPTSSNPNDMSRRLYTVTSPWLEWSTPKQQRVVGGVLQSQDHNVSLLTSDSIGTSRVMPRDVLFSEVLKQSKGDSFVFLF